MFKTKYNSHDSKTSDQSVEKAQQMAKRWRRQTARSQAGRGGYRRGGSDDGSGVKNRSHVDQA